MTLLYGVGALIVLWWLSKTFARGNPAAWARAARQVGGYGSLALALFLLVRGRFDVAFLVGGFGAWLLGWRGFAIPALGRPAKPASGATSRVRSALIEMELDHDTGAMRGAVLAGAFANRKLDDLDERSLLALYGECDRTDPDGRRLLEAYLDRRFPGWRINADRDGDPRPGAQAQPGPMTEEEAYQILGLQPGASADEIRSAHRNLMKRLHPDQGGSTYLAARVNAAKEALLNRHR